MHNKVIINGRVVTGDLVGSGGSSREEITIDGVHFVVENGNVSVFVKEARDITTMSGRVEVEGSVAGDITTMSGSVRVAGEVHGDIETMSGSVRR